MRAAARRFGGTGPRAYRKVLTPSGGSTTSGNGGPNGSGAGRDGSPHGSREHPHAPTVSAASYRHAAEVGALFIGPPLFPAFGVVVADVFDAQLLVFVLQHPIGRVALFCGVRRADCVTFGDPRAVRFRMAAPAERDEVAGRVIPADAAMNDVMNLQAVRVVAQRAAVAITGIDGLSCLVRDGCGQVSSGLHNRSPLSFDTRAATRLSRVANRPGVRSEARV